MAKVRLCFKINGLAVDEDGKPCAAGLCMSFGETEKEFDYMEMAKTIDKAAVLKMAMLDETVSPDDMEIITPEEYDREYGDDDNA